MCRENALNTLDRPINKARIEEHKISDRTEDSLNAQVINLIITCNLPFSFMNCKVFRELVHNLNPNFNMISLRNLREERNADYSNKISLISIKYINFGSNDPLSIIIDEWKSLDKHKMLNVMIKPP